MRLEDWFDVAHGAGLAGNLGFLGKICIQRLPF